MQARLSQLKEVINQFNGLNDETKSTQIALNSTYDINLKDQEDPDETDDKKIEINKDKALNEVLLQEHKK
jgi:hypothetical protein